MSVSRDAVGVCLLGDRLYAVGGYDGQVYLNTVEAYDPQTNEWTQVRLSHRLSVSSSVCLPVSPSVCLSHHLSHRLSVSPFVCLTIFLPVSLCPSVYSTGF